MPAGRPRKETPKIEPTLIRSIRQTLGLNQTDFAAVLGFSRAATVSDFESGRKVPDRQTVTILIHLQTLAQIRTDLAEIRAVLEA